ncbi:MAG: 5-formyltetrahydrofolate cyclo-ligase [Pseudomonadales bacterium]|nr:5-formyltetrahydrofolate cyclo-ligase [Pseudomonadales bacterium]
MKIIPHRVHNKAGKRDKSVLRRKFRQQRRELSADQQYNNAKSVRKWIINSRLLLRCTRVAIYNPFDGELDLSMLTETLLGMGKYIYLPVIKPRSQMEFRQLNIEQGLVDNRFGIPEPDPITSGLCTLGALSVIFIPLVAFDAQGNRLGMGAGYYDRAIGKCPNRPLCIGIGHEIQHCPTLTPEDWDEAMDAVITEKGIRAFSKRAAVALGVTKQSLKFTQSTS